MFRRKRRFGHVQAQRTQTERRRLCDDGGRAGVDAAASQGAPRIVGPQQEAGRGKQGSFHSRLQREQGPADTLSSDITLQNYERINLCYFKASSL